MSTDLIPRTGDVAGVDDGVTTKDFSVEPVVSYELHEGIKEPLLDYGRPANRLRKPPQHNFSVTTHRLTLVGPVWIPFIRHKPRNRVSLFPSHRSPFSEPML